MVFSFPNQTGRVIFGFNFVPPTYKESVIFASSWYKIYGSEASGPYLGEGGERYQSTCMGVRDDGSYQLPSCQYPCVKGGHTWANA